MKLPHSTFILIFAIFFILAFTSIHQGFCSYQVSYNIQLAPDGEASWTISQHGMSSQVPSESFDQFRDKVNSLVATAENETNRLMQVEQTSFKMTTSGSGSYVSNVFQFDWINFSKINQNKISVGDVFQVQGLFQQLYGDGTVEMTYPSSYTVTAISPVPDSQNSTASTLQWLGTLDFKPGEPSLILGQKSANSPGILDTPSSYQLAITIVAVIATAAILIIGYSRLAKRRNSKDMFMEQKEEAPAFQPLEDDAQKVARLLRTAGGSMYQSTISDQCNFSRSKTSQLLGTMENQGLIKRSEKGREKIVTLLETKNKKDEQR